jgi:hypothetical protein
MSLYIDTDSVTAVLLADGWHEVKGKSFDLDFYEYHSGELLVLRGRQEKRVSAAGFVFTDSEGPTDYGPADFGARG